MHVSLTSASSDDEIRAVVGRWVIDNVPEAWRAAAPRGRAAIRAVRPRADYEHAFFAGARNVGVLVGSVRLGGDRAYWPHARAGVGPMLSGGYECQGDTCGFMALAGLQLYGVD